MFGSRYKYNPKTLSYTANGSKRRKLTKFFFLFFTPIFLLGSGITTVLFLTVIKTPETIISEQELLIQKSHLEDIRLQNERNIKLLKALRERDNKLYRVVYEADPISDDIRQAGVGGVDLYTSMRGLSNSELFIKLKKEVDATSNQLFVQMKSYDEILSLAKNKEDLLQSIPAIQPVLNKDLTRTASGYGMRLHPIYKTRRMHAGMDFAAPIGTEVFAPGDGVVKSVRYARGYGKLIEINHGYNYTTRYAHLNGYNVRKGQRVKRGDVIGFVGNTGKSTGPHLHYEVRYKGQAVNPINFYFVDLPPDEYDRMVQISNSHGKTFD